LQQTFQRSCSGLAVTVLDAVGYGVDATLVAEGAPAADADPLSSGHALSLARDLLSTDTNTNAADFFVDPTPTPGAPNTPLAVEVITISTEDGPAFTDTATEITVRDGGIVAGAAGTPVVQIGAQDADCVYLRHDDDLAVFSCTAVRRDGRGTGGVRQLPEGIFADVSFQNPVAIGGSDVAVESFLYDEGSANETGLSIEADFCNVQFPDTTQTIAVGARLPFFGQIFENGLTNQNVGPSPNVVAQFGISRDPAPTTLQAFVFTDADFNTATPNGNGSNDEYTAIFSSGEPGTFRVLFRFSLDGGLNWTACDVGGAGSNGDLDLEFPNAGTVIVTP
jgi:hypothetical protein